MRQPLSAVWPMLGRHAAAFFIGLGQLAVGAAASVALSHFIGASAAATAAFAVSIMAVAATLVAGRRLRALHARLAALEAASRQPDRTSSALTPVVSASSTPEAPLPDRAEASVIAEALIAARGIHGPAEAADARMQPRGDKVAPPPARRWSSIATAAKKCGISADEIRELLDKGIIASRRSKAGNRLVDTAELVSCTQTTAGEAPANDEAVVAAIEAGRVRLEVAPIAVLPSRRPTAVSARLVLRDSSGLPFAMNDRVKAEVAAQHDLMMLAFVAVTIQSRPATVLDRPMLMSIATSSLCHDGFRDELEALCVEDSAVAGQLVFVLPLDALGRADLVEAIDQLLDLGIRFAVTSPPGAIDQLLEMPPAFKERLTFAAIDAPTLLVDTAQTASLIQAGLQTIAFDVKTERELVELLDIGIELASGPLFAPARPAPVHLPTALAA